MRQWTPHQRARQALRIRQYSPWLKSTGPKTIEGKRVSSCNAYNSRLHTPEIKAIRGYLDASFLLLKTLARKRKEMEEAEKAARRAAKKVLHITGDAPLLITTHCPPLAGGQLNATKREGSFRMAPPTESRYAHFGSHARGERNIGATGVAHAR